MSDLYVSKGDKITASKYNALVDVATGNLNYSDYGFQNTGTGSLFPKDSNYGERYPVAKNIPQLFEIKEEYGIYIEYLDSDYGGRYPDGVVYYDQGYWSTTVPKESGCPRVYTWMNIGNNVKELKNAISYYGRHPDHFIANIIYGDSPYENSEETFASYFNFEMPGYYKDNVGNATTWFNLDIGYPFATHAYVKTPLSSDPPVGLYAYFANATLSSASLSTTKDELYCCFDFYNPGDDWGLSTALEKWDFIDSMLSRLMAVYLSGDWKITSAKADRTSYCIARMKYPLIDETMADNGWVQYIKGSLTVGESGSGTAVQSTGNWAWPTDSAGNYIKAGDPNCVMGGMWAVGDRSYYDTELLVPEQGTADFLCLSGCFARPNLAGDHTLVWSSYALQTNNISSYVFPIWKCNNGLPVWDCKPGFYNVPCYT